MDSSKEPIVSIGPHPAYFWFLMYINPASWIVTFVTPLPLLRVFVPFDFWHYLFEIPATWLGLPGGFALWGCIVLLTLIISLSYAWLTYYSTCYLYTPSTKSFSITHLTSSGMNTNNVAVQLIYDCDVAQSFFEMMFSGVGTLTIKVIEHRSPTETPPVVVKFVRDAYTVADFIQRNSAMTKARTIAGV